MVINEFLNIQPYSLDKISKSKILDSQFFKLSQYHYENCNQYKNMLDVMGYNYKDQRKYSEIPFLPVRLFKMFDLYSVPKEKIVKTMTSSGTSGQKMSKIYLDKKAALNQSKALTKIVSTYLGPKRTPMIIIDSSSILKDRNMFSARGAGILGFSIFGTKRLFALDDNMELKVDEVVSFIQQNQGNRIFIFGFTFMVYQHFIQEIKKKTLTQVIARKETSC